MKKINLEHSSLSLSSSGTALIWSSYVDISSKATSTLHAVDLAPWNSNKDLNGSFLCALHILLKFSNVFKYYVDFFF